MKFVRKEHVENLITVLSKHYNLGYDWGGTKYCGISLDLDYVKPTKIHLFMTGYVEKAVQKFKHLAPKHNDQSLEHLFTHHMSKLQYTATPKTSGTLNK